MDSETDNRPPLIVSSHVAANIDRVIQAVRNYLEMDIAFVSEFLGADRMLRYIDTANSDAPLHAGMLVSMSQGYCKHVVSGELPQLIADTRAVPLAMSLPETPGIPIGAHLSVPIDTGDGRVYGTFCCISYTPRPEL